MEEEVKTVKIEVQVKTVELEVGTKPLVAIQVETTKNVVKETNVEKDMEYFHFIFGHFTRISRTDPKYRGVMLRENEYMVWMNKAFG
jgi:hypothetical protein